jgi:hypothetical protein
LILVLDRKVVCLDEKEIYYTMKIFIPHAPQNETAMAMKKDKIDGKCLIKLMRFQ